MLKENEIRILKNLKNKDLVLDIGGWDKPFNRANYVLDIHPYETRGFHGNHGGKKEWFNKKTWIIHDVCSRKKLPFKDKQFDFVICSQILEDIRDPIWLCSEIIRIGMAGYIEVPAMEIELTKGIMDNNYVGYYHHRWLTQIRDKKIIFRFKPHFIHNDRKFHFPKKFLRKLLEKNKISFLFWVKDFKFEERIQISRDKFEKFIFSYIKKRFPHRRLYFLLNLKDKINNFFIQIKKKILPRSYFHKSMDVREIRSH